MLIIMVKKIFTKKLFLQALFFLLHFDCMQLVQVYFELFHHFQLQPEKKLDLR